MRGGLRLAIAVWAAGLRARGRRRLPRKARRLRPTNTPAADAVGPKELQNFSLSGPVTRPADEPPQRTARLLRAALAGTARDFRIGRSAASRACKKTAQTVAPVRTVSSGAAQPIARPPETQRPGTSSPSSVVALPPLERRQPGTGSIAAAAGGGLHPSLRSRTSCAEHGLTLLAVAACRARARRGRQPSCSGAAAPARRSPAGRSSTLFRARAVADAGTPAQGEGACARTRPAARRSAGSGGIGFDPPAAMGRNRAPAPSLYRRRRPGSLSNSSSTFSTREMRPHATSWSRPAYSTPGRRRSRTSAHSSPTGLRKASASRRSRRFSA